MMEQMQKLLRMQCLQQEKKALVREMEQLNTDDLRILWQDIRLLGQCIAADKEKLVCLKKVCERQEAELAKAMEHYRQLEATLYGGNVKNVKELEQISSKCTMEKREIENREEEYFRSLAYGEELDAKITAQERTLADKQELHAQKRQQALKSKADTEKKLSALENELKILTEEIKPELLTRYCEISRRCVGAVARVSSGVCTGCRMSIPTRQASFQTEIVYCDNCGRMLLIE